MCACACRAGVVSRYKSIWESITTGLPIQQMHIYMCVCIRMHARTRAPPCRPDYDSVHVSVRCARAYLPLAHRNEPITWCPLTPRPDPAAKPAKSRARGANKSTNEQQQPDRRAGGPLMRARQPCRVRRPDRGAHAWHEGRKANKQGGARALRASTAMGHGMGGAVSARAGPYPPCE
jgi:hypothetical protein